MSAQRVNVWRTHKSLIILIPRQVVQELGLIPGQRMAFMPYKNGMRVIPLEPHQTAAWWMQVRKLFIKKRNRLHVVLPSAMCRTLGLKVRDVIKIKLDGPDYNKFFVLTRQEEFIAAMSLHGKPSIHLVARPVTADGRVDETCPCIRKILPYPVAATRLGGMEIYDAGEFAEELEAHLRTARPFHDVAPETMPAGSVFEECQTSMIEDQARRLTVLRTVQQIRSASAPYIEYGQVTRAGTKTQGVPKSQLLENIHSCTNGTGTWTGPRSTDGVHAIQERDEGNPTGASPDGDAVDAGTQTGYQRTGQVARGAAVDDVPNIETQSQEHD